DHSHERRPDGGRYKFWIRRVGQGHAAVHLYSTFQLSGLDQMVDVYLRRLSYAYRREVMILVNDCARAPAGVVACNIDQILGPDAEAVGVAMDVRVDQALEEGFSTIGSQ